MPKPKRILIVDDHSDTRFFMSRLLTRAGYETTIAAGQAEALQLCRANHFDVLISDLMLADGHGLDLLHEVQKLYPIKAIACSGMDDERKRCLSGGFAEYFAKPIQLANLLTSLKESTEAPSRIPSETRTKVQPRSVPNYLADDSALSRLGESRLLYFFQTLSQKD